MRTLTAIPDLAQQFYAPFDSVILKAQEEDNKWIVYMEASNEQFDVDDEFVLQKALKDAADYYMQHGVLSWDHKHKKLNDPSYIIGEPLDVAFPDTKQTLVKGRLYKENKRASGLWENLMSKSTRFGSSIGGYILNKNELQKAVDKVFWDEIAITHQPKNEILQGRTSVIPFSVFAKALMAGSGVDAAAFTGGRALTPESLQGNTVDILQVTDDELETLFDRLFDEVRNGRIKSFNDLMAFVLDFGYSSSVAADIIRFISLRTPELIGQLRR